MAGDLISSPCDVGLFCRHGKLPPDRVIEREQVGHPGAFYDQVSKITRYHFYLIVFIRSELLNLAHAQGEEN